MKTEHTEYTEEMLDKIDKRINAGQDNDKVEPLKIGEDPEDGTLMQGVVKKVLSSWTATDIMAKRHFADNYFQLDGFSFVMVSVIEYNEEISIDILHVDEYREKYGSDNSRMNWIDSLVPIDVDNAQISIVKDMLEETESAEKDKYST